MSFSFFMPVGLADILRHSPFYMKGHSHGQSSFLFSMRSAMVVPHKNHKCQEVTR